MASELRVTGTRVWYYYVCQRQVWLMAHQLLYYLRELKRMGIEAVGELRIPEEKRVIKISLDVQSEEELERTERDILRIIYLDKPPKAKKVPWCRSCAYRELCWS